MCTAACLYSPDVTQKKEGQDEKGIVAEYSTWRTINKKEEGTATKEVVVVEEAKRKRPHERSEAGGRKQVQRQKQLLVRCSKSKKKSLENCSNYTFSINFV